MNRKFRFTGVKCCTSQIACLHGKVLVGFDAQQMVSVLLTGCISKEFCSHKPSRHIGHSGMSHGGELQYVHVDSLSCRSLN